MAALGESGTRKAWRLSGLPGETVSAAITIDLDSTSKDSLMTAWDSEPATSCAAGRFMRSLAEKPVGGLVKLLLPLQSGYVMQSDFLERRMVDCPDVEQVQGFTAPGQHIEGRTTEEYRSMAALPSLLPYCYGALRLQAQDGSSASRAASEAVDAELANRISFPWLSAGPVARKRLALVGSGSLAKARGYLAAAASLNIGLVVFDDPGHWMAGEAYSRFRDDFVALDIGPGEEEPLVARIVDRLRAYQQQQQQQGDAAEAGSGGLLDGVLSFDEHLHTVVASVASRLGLPTSPPESVGLAQNKFRTRQLDRDVFCRLVRSRDDVDALLAGEGPGLQFPLIVKPARGWSSEGVWKVRDAQELRDKTSLLWRESFTAWHGRDVVVETYVDGPEVDANMVLVDGEVVFFEVNDDFPSTGDGDGDGDATNAANFVETSNMLPSALPGPELASVQEKLHTLALAAGFRNAVLHIEAKLRNSRCRYAADPHADGLTDLLLLDDGDDSSATTTTSTQPSDVFLLEINPRAPGWQEVEATARVYGVSYYALSLLNALADKTRIRALSGPFCRGPQYFMQLLFVSAQKGGTYRFGDICGKVLRADDPGHRLASHVAYCANLMEDGEQVLDPSMGQVYGNFIAFFLVVSRHSRKDALRVGHQIELRVRELTDNF